MSSRSRPAGTRRLKWVALVVAVMEAGFMAFDGLRALVVGDYVTPQSGQFAGQLGPWAALVSALGIDPRSTGMKATFAIYGFAWLVVIAAYARGTRWSWWAMIVAAVASLWYLPVGTVASAMLIVLLIQQRPNSRVREVATASVQKLH